jgi:hypothetical protein
VSTQTDRELLEQAAKAAGYEIEERHFGAGRYALRLSTDPNWVEWNPLTDDGDALRLAMRLGLRIMTSNTGNPMSAYSCVETPDDRGWTEMHRSHNGDANAATRRAIVRAAAAIAAIPVKGGAN